MGSLYFLEAQGTYASAAARAKTLAVRLRHPVYLKQVDGGNWALLSAVRDLTPFDDSWAGPWHDNAGVISSEDPMAARIAEEFADLQDDLARSEEEGWFYSD